MNRKVWLGAIGALLFLLLAFAGLRPAGSPPEAAPRAHGPHVPKEIDLGRVTRPTEFTIRAENRGARKLDVRIVSRTCGCLWTKVDALTLMPGEARSVPFGFRPGGRRGRKTYAVDFLIVGDSDARSRAVSGRATTLVHADACPLQSIEPHFLTARQVAAVQGLTLRVAARAADGAPVRGLQCSGQRHGFRVDLCDVASIAVHVPAETFAVGGVHRLTFSAEVQGVPATDTPTLHVQPLRTAIWMPGRRLVRGSLRISVREQGVSVALPLSGYWS